MRHTPRRIGCAAVGGRAAAARLPILLRVPKLPVTAKRVPAKWYAAAIGAVGLAVSAAFGGLHPVPQAAAADQTRVNTVIVGGPWNVTVIDARVLKSQQHLEVVTTGDRWLAVVANVTVTAKESLYAADILRLRDVTGVASASPDRILLARDGTDVDYLNPGMTERVAFLWEQKPRPGPLPATVDVDVYGETYRASNLSGSIVPGSYAWFDRRVIATVTAPVLDKRT